MEFAAASFQVILDKVAGLIFNQVGLICNADAELRKLQRTLARVQSMVDYLQHHGPFFHGLNGALKMFVEDIDRFTYDADDLLDTIFLKLPATSNNTNFLNHHLHTQVCKMVISSPKKLGIPNKIKKIKDDLEIIASQMESLYVYLPKMDLMDKSSSMNHISSRNPYATSDSSLVDYDTIVGRDAERKELINRLQVEGTNEIYNVSVIPIVGMGGIGKTTLAQLAYNDTQVKDIFKLRMWVSVSMKSFDLIKITKSIIESATETSCSLSDLNPLQAKLQGVLKGEKFLLVLDNIWSEKPEYWDTLFTSLQVGCKGSKIIVTTRSEVVSSIVGQGTVCNLKPLTDDECWKVMKQKAFANMNLMEDDNLSEIGKNIAKKCKGLPLAAKTLGSVLQFKCSEQDWISVLESELWHLPEDTNEIYPSLALSYHHLPAHLKKCFAYCSIFPRNYQFEMDDVVLLWMAEGFLWPRGQIRLEDIGNEYFMDLARRSFFHFSDVLDVDGVSKSIYVMHDLIHDLAHLVSSNTCFPLENDFSKYSHVEFKNPRHISLQLMKPVELKAPNWFKKLRTLILVCENNPCIDLLPYELFTKLKSIRVLNLNHSGIDELPGSIERMKHLRYLNLSKNDIRKLPESITKLCGLQTLKLNECTSFLELPVNLKNLTNLRHLHLDVKNQLRSMPSGMGSLTKLQTLSAFIVGNEEGRSISELKNMQLLRGSICITNLDNVSSATEARGASLDEKPYIDKLVLEWKRIQTTGDTQIEILQNLKPHKNVKSLVITKYSGSSLPSWLTDPFSRFRTIEIQNCQNCRSLPSLGLLRFLEDLKIGCMPSLVSIGRELCGNANVTVFPALKTLTLEDMPSLKEWKELSVNDMPNLHELTIMDCPSLVGLPRLDALNALHSLNIAQCKELESLPEGGLPESLDTLIILKCPNIERRCKDRNGEDWEKIQNVRVIEIDYHPLESSISALRI